MDTQLTGKVWVVGDSVTTDAMYPAFAMKLPVPEAARHIFYELRPGWTDQVVLGDIVVAGRNFGLGSSRPVAALFRELGVAALVAEEFNSLFLRNCINHGLPALTVPGVTSAFTDGATMRLDFAEGWVENPERGVRLTGALCRRWCSTSSRPAASCPSWPARATSRFHPRQPLEPGGASSGRRWSTLPHATKFCGAPVQASPRSSPPRSATLSCSPSLRPHDPACCARST
ncbi:hypothetical protein [Streptomyces sp. NPDC085937]|uniref:hypothetical protein n=1 Tax=Streptomyces sp. NPDC085937 TaxID=3365742 RepID=UPI0037D8B8C9